MALINCIECTKSISDLAETCPHCGASIELSKEGFEKKVERKCFECNTILKEEEVCPNCGVNQSLNSKKESVIKENLKKDKVVSTSPKIKKQKERIVIQQAPKKSKWFRNLLIFFVIIIGLGYVALKMLPSDVQKDFFHEVGIEDSDFVGSNSMGTYVETGEILQKVNLSGKWVISGVLFNSHPSKTVTSVTLKFNFSDGNEERTKSLKMSPDDLFGRPFREKFSGHKGASFYGVDVISAK